MRDQYIKSGAGFLLVYSVADHLSSHSLAAFHEQIIVAGKEKGKLYTTNSHSLDCKHGEAYFFLVCLLLRIFVVAVGRGGGDLSFGMEYKGVENFYGG